MHLFLSYAAFQKLSKRYPISFLRIAQVIDLSYLKISRHIWIRANLGINVEDLSARRDACEKRSRCSQRGVYYIDADARVETVIRI